ncbi:putative predicted protein [Rhizobium favelukesii]|uniref:Uncharacterized protein n=1 Tax=Rhizobium favelukesii TaxID=348824 RepID=W6RGJ6_9HYPH|nr:putative predicted protein [Rhizobium favelukesii]
MRLASHFPALSIRLALRTIAPFTYSLGEVREISIRQALHRRMVGFLNELPFVRR